MTLRRSVLMTPGDNEELLRKLPRCNADVGILELEDGVHSSRKELARETIARVLKEVDWGPCERIVRINLLDSEQGLRDIEAVVPATPNGLLLPKVRSAEEVRRAASLVGERERESGVPKGSVRLWAMVETAETILNIEDICEADERMSAVVFGAADLGVELQVKRLGLRSDRPTGFPAFEYYYPRGRVVVAARAAGIDPIDIGNSLYEDDEGTRRAAEFSAQCGFAGCLVATRRQVEIVNAAFSPSDDDLKWAREAVEKSEAAGQDEGRAIVILDGEVIEGPFIVNARQILARQKLIEERAAL